jgi:hypothetical protein
MGRFVSATGQFLLATNGQLSWPPVGNFRWPLTAASRVKIAVVERTSSGNTPIRARRTIVENLVDREADIKAAVLTCAKILNESAAAAPSSSNGSLGISEIEATSGLVVSGEGSLIVSKASVEASLEITIKLERK